MEREIKVGSKWRVASVDVTVKAFDDTVLAAFDGREKQSIEVSRDAWYQIAVWVSDPVEAPKVGTWWRRKPTDCATAGLPMQVTGIGPDEFVRLDAFGRMSEKRLDGFFSTYEPCDPPPLHKALGELVAENKRVSAPGVFYFGPFIDLAIKVARLYEGGER